MSMTGARLIQAIEVRVRVGAGILADPVRIITEYYSTEGEMLASKDAWSEEQFARREAERRRSA